MAATNRNDPIAMLNNILITLLIVSVYNSIKVWSYLELESVTTAAEGDVLDAEVVAEFFFLSPFSPPTSLLLGSLAFFGFLWCTLLM